MRVGVCGVCVRECVLCVYELVTLRRRDRRELLSVTGKTNRSGSHTCGWRQEVRALVVSVGVSGQEPKFLGEQLGQTSAGGLQYELLLRQLGVILPVVDCPGVQLSE